MQMREVIRLRIWWLFLALFFFPVAPLHAQTNTTNIAAASTDCSVTASCVGFSIVNAGSVSVSVSGTFSATLQFEGSTDHGQTWKAFGMNDLSGASSTAASSATAAGWWQANAGTLTDVRVRCSTYGSGTPVVTVTASPVIARRSLRSSGRGAQWDVSESDDCISFYHC